MALKGRSTIDTRVTDANATPLTSRGASRPNKAGRHGLLPVGLTHKANIGKIRNPKAKGKGEPKCFVNEGGDGIGRSTGLKAEILRREQKKSISMAACAPTITDSPEEERLGAECWIQPRVGCAMFHFIRMPVRNRIPH